MAESLKKGMIIDGVATSTAIDTSGEVLNIEGLDISDLVNGQGVINFEHNNDLPQQIIGRVTFAKKILKEEDAKTDREKMYWEKLERPFVYHISELFDDEGHPGSIAAAAIMRHYKRRGLPILARYSIEGSTLDRQGNFLSRAVGRRLALTLRPANKSAFAGIIKDPNDKGSEVRDDFSDLISDLPGVNPDMVKNISQESDREFLMKGEYVGVNPLLEAIDITIDAPTEKDLNFPDFDMDRLAKGFRVEVDRIEDPEKAMEITMANLSINENFYVELDKKEQEIYNRLHNSMEKLHKALTAGGMGAAPGTLTGGAALQREDLSKDYETHKSQAKAAYKDWDRKGSFKDFLKHRLPDASPAFIDKYADLVDEIRLKKNQNFMEMISKSDKVGEVRDSNSVEFDGKHVIPGHGLINYGPNKGREVHIVHEDPHHAIVTNRRGEPQLLHNDKDSPNSKFVKVSKNPHGLIHIFSTPTSFNADQPILNSAKDGDSLNITPDQHDLYHGLDMNDVTAAPETSMTNHTGHRMGHAYNRHGKKILIKEALSPLKSIGLDEFAHGRYSDGSAQGYSTAHRETLFHNLARDIFGLDQYVPSTATFKDIDGTPHSVQEWKQDATLNSYKKNEKHQYTVDKLRSTGEMQKMAIMDTILGQSDRNGWNYLIGENNDFHLIDNARSFDYAHPQKNITSPVYLRAHDDNHDIHSEPLHNEARAWLQSIDPGLMDKYLGKYEVPRWLNMGASNAINAARNSKSETIGSLLEDIKKSYEGYRI